MNNSYVNESIRCTVNQCKNHAQSKDNCALSSILVGTHEHNPTQDQCTDCKSFQMK
ncbi:DUF1540 domain-containing protein [Aminipila butyrica]|uniref:DUF1540 domain-containing protein n=1 Tax=Aminipila butyrica TaxID=433296 RepID=A0A858BXQ8_9FIRM|nr:DUF1540 domain-containing protein [Aminipila butyrica]QIB69875.1 DUF1540 domain-containing protein [Aminipila butyrica]